MSRKRPVRREPPTGVVTFLLTDVEASTRLWREAPRAAALMARQAELIAAAVDRHDGVRPLEQGEGDSIVAAFARPSDALAAAVEAQRALHAEPWPDGAALRVRMAVHTGEAELRDDATYGGESIIRCARIRALTRGGHVLVSNATAALSAGRLPDGVTLVELRAAVTLDGFERPERVHQLAHPDLDPHEPPLRSSAPRNLPQWPTSLVGRDHERIEVAALIANARLVTITGAGGSGKTRLAHAIAADRAANWGDGVAWVELARLSAGAQVAGTVAAACGAQELTGASALNVLVLHLAKREMLVVLDNCEHVLGDCALLAEAVLRGSPRVTILATSREPLGASGEVTWRIPSLSVPDDGDRDPEHLASFDAMRLFAERARAARPEFALDADSVVAAARICRRLDGIPLALELAAARLRALSLRQLAEGLDDRFRLLTGGVRTAMARQRTLLASVEWSHDLLDDDERLVFRRLGVLASPFSLEAAEALVADDEIDRLAVFDLLARLVDKSLLQHGVERYAMLETLRQYALERARVAGELAELRDRHLAWCRRRAAGWQLDREIATEPVIAEIAAEVPDLIAAVEWSLSPGRRAAIEVLHPLGQYWESLNGWAEARAVAGTVLTGLEESSREWLEAVAALALSLFFGGELGWVPGARRVLEDREHDIDPAVRGRIELALGIGPALSGEREGFEGLRRAIEAGRAANNRALEFSATATLALQLTIQGDRASARPLISWLDRHAPHDAAQPYLLDNAHGVAVCYDGDFGRALAFLVSHTERPRDIRVIGLVAGIALWTRDTALCRRVAAALESVVAAGLFEQFSPYARAMIALVDGELEEARRQLEVAMGGWVPGALAVALRTMLADTLVSLGDRAAAETVLATCEPLLSAGTELHYARSQMWLSRAQIGMSRGEWVAAENLAQEALATAIDHDMGLTQTEALEALALIAFEKDDPAAAARLLGAVEAFRKRTGYSWRFPHREEALAAMRLQLPAAQLAEGGELSLVEAAEYARRGWGERGRPSHGWDSLTPSELRVVELVAAGLPNRDIAAKLFVSLATVKTHLVHVYTKLDVRTRTELAAAATRRGLAAAPRSDLVEDDHARNR